MSDTIYALSSGALPAAIGIIRISGPAAGSALASLAGGLPPERMPVVRKLRDHEGDTLDVALVLWFPGRRTATGEDLAELHCHGGRAVVAAVLNALAAKPGLREAEPGEFTRRAFLNGRVDLAEAEGLGDLLSAETELQRRGAMQAAGGAVSRRIDEWRSRVLALAAAVEAVIDFADEDDVAALPDDFTAKVAELACEIRQVAARPEAERLRDGVRVVLGGPPNVGKSSLFNALLSDDAAIVTDVAGTTRDVLERPIAFGGVPFILIDTAGVRDEGAEAIEAMGIERARREIAEGHIVLWLGAPAHAPEGSIVIRAKADLDASSDVGDDQAVSVVTGLGLPDLIDTLIKRGRGVLPPVDRIGFNRRQKQCALEAAACLDQVDTRSELLIAAENLRLARFALDRLVGRDSTEEMLDALFGQFCIGK
ncbi:tRNA uridine-5-carboxymethylaminomethyl(34) synthesis GTPase MnmE [Qipengyuania flava]|uniref:tRNA uridine-5-carboxymethylaminomethyl(34) synthesis GTPase MnmE n=1 Tax=Qipengyuania flava TaxID=192812 RepID=UPI001C59B745|nr:tRNA uridine-5-carboxymethylaminomethyl(34) synthesis GTPase MnmE [Qipengyuania flava]MBW3166889.1 tRNA uridine-5-carboxymethylaminomethyl(34) synthesis GTPase MnmE [Qipengyuania flava]MBY5964127.1 tRNA uridine-5-carboxymethylaminomethyl(34) synthesis GTPase MnmE [Qipengyuania flava]MBY6010451.1 tRNA uridine-5-carboxymethylaminomethyl(34) synthesis GTPase MnmE [Qipengyuania flava]MBY6024893.1 tRNA uridine-5-carboxymethylaminomethyl(34) synthesis GTPase MnmE [Qipengyuania flava]